MKRQFFSGNTLEQAVMLAARHFGIDPERVAYSVREKKHGFIKVRRRVVIEVDGEAPERSPDELTPAATNEPARSVPADPGPAADSGPAADPGPAAEPEPFVRRSAARRRDAEGVRADRSSLSESASVERAVREVLRFLDVEAEVAVERREDLFEVEISNPDQDVLFDREGRVLQAMEYLVPRVVRSWMGQGVPVKVDCDGFRAEREQELRELALEIADEVCEDGVSQSLEPMNPADRRQVHLALADRTDVYTESEGEGYFKRVRVFPEDEDEPLEAV